MTDLEVVVLDVNETLSDLEPLRARFTDVGAPGHLLETWFAGALRDGFALAAAGRSQPFPHVGAAGLRVVTLTNGSLPQSEALLDRAGVDDLVEQRLSVDDAGRWKPHPDAYAWAARSCGVPLAACAMVAVHPWDLMGASSVGMTSGWIDRSGTPWPDAFDRPDVTGTTLAEVAAALTVPGRPPAAAATPR